MGSALVISFIAAWFVIPLIADRLVSPRDAEREEKVPRLYARVLGGYRGAFSRARKRPLLVVIALAVLIAGGTFAYFRVGTGFMPAMDEGGFILDYIAPPGTSLSDTNRMLLELESIIRSTPDVDTYSRRTGLQLGGGLSEANIGDYFIRLKRGSRRPIDVVMEDIRHRAEENIPGLNIETAQLMEDLIGDLTAVPQPIEIELFGDNEAALQRLGTQVAGLIAHVRGVTEIKNGVVIAGDALAIEVNPELARLEGLAPAAIAAQVETTLAGSVATHVQERDRVIAVRVWSPGGAQRSLADVGGILLTAPDGHVLALSRVATVRLLTGQPQITRDNLKTMVDVTARIEGRDLGSTAADVKRTIDQSRLISGSTYYELGGLYKQQQIAFRGLMAVIVAAFFLVFALLLFLYERFRFAFSIVLMPLLAMPAVFIGLWLTGIELNITAMMGMTMVVGIVTEVAIFYASEYRLLLAGGKPSGEALLDAGVNRLRPIAMTTLATILTLLPLALGLGQGAAMQQPLAVAIISGLIVQMPLVLIVMPLLTERLGRIGARVAGVT
jgi:multidrug efflux pump subunit AcrB